MCRWPGCAGGADTEGNNVVVSLDEYSFDDLHSIALAEFDGDGSVAELLNEAYHGLRAEYIAILEGLRVVREFVA